MGCFYVQRQQRLRPDCCSGPGETSLHCSADERPCTAVSVPMRVRTPTCSGTCRSPGQQVAASRHPVVHAAEAPVQQKHLLRQHACQDVVDGPQRSIDGRT